MRKENTMTKSVEIFERANKALAAMQKTADAHGFGKAWSEFPNSTIDQKITILRIAWEKRSIRCARALEAALRVEEEICSVTPDWLAAKFWVNRVEEYAK